MQSTSKPSALPERAAQIDTLVLHRSAHASFEHGHCFMEAVSWVAGEQFTDHPQCVCPVIGAYVRSWNDRIPGDELRTSILRPLLLEVIGTRGSEALERRRRYAIVDTTIRSVLPMMLHALKLDDLAKAAEALPPIVDESTQREGRQHCLDLSSTLRGRANAANAAYAAAAYAATAAAAAADAAAYAAAALRSKLQGVQVDLVRHLCTMVEEP